MIDNGNFYSKESGIPRAALDEAGNLSSILDNSLDNFDKVKAEASSLTNKVRKDAASEVVNSVNRTVFNRKNAFPVFSKKVMLRAGLATGGAMAVYKGLNNRVKVKVQEIGETGVFGPIGTAVSGKKENIVPSTVGAATGGFIGGLASKKLLIDPVLTGSKKTKMPLLAAGTTGATLLGILGGSYAGVRAKEKI